MNHRDLKTIVKSIILEVTGQELKNLGRTSERTGLKTLRVFDFDDTIARTNSKVGVTEFDINTKEQLGDQYFITPAKYAKFKTDVAPLNPDVHYEFDYSQFKQVVEPQLIDHTFNILKRIVGKIKEEEKESIPAVILTARGHAANENIREFLRSLDINIPVKTLDGSAPELKSEWIKQTMLARNIPHVEFFDDSELNVKAVKNLENDSELIEKFGPDLRIKSRLVK